MEKGCKGQEGQRKYERLPTLETMIRTSICSAHKHYRQLANGWYPEL